MKITNKEIRQHYLKIKYITYFFNFSGYTWKMDNVRTSRIIVNYIVNNFIIE